MTPEMHLLTVRLRHICSSVFGLYTSSTTRSWKEKLLLLLTCFITSFILSGLVFLILQFSFRCVQEISVSISCGVCVCLTPAMYFSGRTRCFAGLLLISMGLKQVRSLLLTFGTSLVVFFNIRNALRNARLLATGLLCNLEEKLLDINTEPLGNYIKMLKWVGKQLQRVFDTFELGRYQADLRIKADVNSERFKLHLAEKESALNGTVRSVLALTDALSSVGQILSPTLGLLLLTLLTALYLKRFHADTKYNNIYISKHFQRFDEAQRRRGQPCVLPLTKRESKRYIQTPSISLSAQRWKAMIKFSIPIYTHCLTWLLFIGLDSLIYWLIAVLNRRLGDLEPLRVPVGIKLQEATLFLGLPLDENAEVGNFSYTVSLFEKKCLPKPELWFYKSLLPLSVILVLLVLLSLLSSQLTQLRVLLSEQFFSDVAEKRAAHLHAKILRKRNKYKGDELKQALKISAVQPSFWCPLLFHEHRRDPEHV